MPTLFTMNADVADFIAPSLAGSAGMEIRFHINVAGGLMRVTDTDRPMLLKYRTATGYVRSDGRMYDTPAKSPSEGGLDVDDHGEVGVRLLANDPDLNLDGDLTYRVSSARLVNGRKVVDEIAFHTTAVPSADIEADLADFSPGPGETLSGINRGLPGAPVDDVQYNGTSHNVEFRVQGVVVGTLALSVLLDALTDGAPGALDTLNELAAALGDDANFGATVTAALTRIAALAGGADGQDTSIASGALVARNPLYIDPTQAPYNVKFDRYTYTTASMSSSSSPTQLTVTGYTFTAADVGKYVKVVGAAASGANLKTTITGVSSGKAVLASPCLTTVSNAYCIFGTDNATALQLLFDDLSSTSRTRKLSKVAVMPQGAAMFSGTLIAPKRSTLKGATENWLEYDSMYGRFGGSENYQGTVLYQMWDQNVDGMRFRDINTGQHDWSGTLIGFSLNQDLDNTAGRGFSFRNAAGDNIKVIDGGKLVNIAAMGWCSEGFDFAGGSITATYDGLQAFCCGYSDVKDFTCDITSGSSTITNISDMTGLVFGSRLSAQAGIPVDATIQSVNVGASTAVLTVSATATTTGLAVQAAGTAGVKYAFAGTECIEFRGLSGDQNGLSLLKLTNNPAATGASCVITAMKNEYGVNVYHHGYLPTGDITGHVPQGANAIVCDGIPNACISVRGLTHWADATSSVGGGAANTKGRDIGAAILVTANGTSAPDITYEGLVVRIANGSGQTLTYAIRDNHSVNILPIPANSSGKGTNRVRPNSYRLVSDSNTTLSVHDGTVSWGSLTASRTGTLPALSAVPAGREYILADSSGSASSAMTISVAPNGSDTLVGESAITNAYGVMSIISTGAKWVARALTGTRFEAIRDKNGVTAIRIAPTTSAVNFLRVSNADANNAIQLAAEGSDTNVPIMFVPKGFSSVQIYVGTGLAARITANGPDDNHPLNLQSKGTSPVQINGVEASRRTPQSVTSAITLGASGDYVLFIGASGAPTLPTAVGNTGRYSFKNVHTTTKSIATTSSELIDGAAAPYSLPPGAVVELISDGTHWRVF